MCALSTICANYSGTQWAFRNFVTAKKYFKKSHFSAHISNILDIGYQLPFILLTFMREIVCRCGECCEAVKETLQLDYL